ncbi:TonB-dependent receptor plug domain-containing protein [Endozoicomonas lisbonensis]|uniref:TonB-dependent receptor plug domain-containing protein n=1 Tax=Endozoicomonas lisbonensis TaxID=3120522 RepID=A0ABV2SJT1_9GAMM
MNKKSLYTAILIGASNAAFNVAMAQTEAIELGELDIADTAATAQTSTAVEASYESYDPVDSGVSVINEQSVQNSRGGGIDTTELLEQLPFVQMDVERERVTQENIQSIRPSDFSISGGNYYDNNIMINGVSANSVHDATPQSDNSIEDVYGQTSQTFYVDPSLIGSVEVFDSNVSAKYGDFMGGVVNYNVRDPKKEFGMNLSVGYQSDSMVKYNVDRKTLDEGEVLDPKPEFSKYTTSISFDLPVNEQLSLLTAYTRAESSVNYRRDDSFGGGKFSSGDTSENFLLKAVYEHSENLTFDGQIMYSPYDSEREQPNRFNSYTTSESSGLQGYLGASGVAGNTDWNTKLSFMHNDSSRESANELIRWTGSTVDWCDATNCFDGGIGDLEQTQTDYTWNFDASTPLFAGLLNYGAEWRHTVAEKNRTSEYNSYTSAKTPDEGISWDCRPGDPACKGDNVATQYTNYGKNDARVTVNSRTLWSEYIQDIGSVSIRAGARLTHDDFLKNANFAPRLTTSWEFMDDTFLTLGANRYYSSSMVGYAIRSKESDRLIYRREVDEETGEIGDWELSSSFSPTQYGESDLDTPYSDELTAALTIPTALDGTLRLKSVMRKYRKQFSSSDRIYGEDGKSYHFEMANDGATDYIGHSIEWSGSYDNHFFNANVTWSETKNKGQSDYFDFVDPEDDNNYVYYRGEIISLSELHDIEGRQNFAAPFRARVSWSTNWFDESLMTHVSATHRGAYTHINKTRDTIEIDDTEYDMYEKTKKKAFTTVDLNSRYRLIKTADYEASVEVKIRNLFNNLPHTTTTSGKRYQMGRAYWVGLNFSI